MSKLLRFLMLIDDNETARASSGPILPTPWQLVALTLLGAVLWTLVAYQIRSQASAGPIANPDPVWALLQSLAKAPIVGFISIWLCRFIARLSLNQLLAGVTYITGVLILIDGAVVRWFPAIYGYNEAVLRQTAGGLLWGYGVAEIAALIWVYWGILLRAKRMHFRAFPGRNA